MHKQDDVMTWKHFLHYWPSVKGIHYSLVDYPSNGPVTCSISLILARKAVEQEKLLNKQLSRWWFGIPWHSYKVTVMNNEYRKQDMNMVSISGHTVFKPMWCAFLFCFILCVYQQFSGNFVMFLHCFLTQFYFAIWHLKQGVSKKFSASVQSLKPKMFFSLIHSFKKFGFSAARSVHSIFRRPVTSLDQNELRNTVCKWV